MENKLILVAIFAIFVGLVPAVRADVLIPEDEILGYFDSNEIYTVVGAVKNTESYPISSTVHLTIDDGKQKVTVEQSLPTVFPNKDMPFKIKLPEVIGPDVVIESYSVAFEQDLSAKESQVAILYDRNLTLHADGHLSGKIMNKGNQTEYNIKIYATIHGENNSFIDVAQNLEKIEKIEPNQILDFTMYSDPTIADKIHYYSCFVLGDETIVPLYAIRDGEKFNFRYDSPAASFVVRGFDETGIMLTLDGINSFKFPTYANFEFPKISGNEKFDVRINDKPVHFIQSVDEQGNWHVAFDMPESVQNRIVISGFAKSGQALPQKDVQTDKTVAVNNVSSKILQESDYSFLYYVIPVAAAALVGIFVFLRKKAKTSA